MKNIRFYICLLALASVLSLGACNTIEGIGQDATAAGNAVTNAAKGNKTY